MVDDFSTKLYSDTENPQYAADIERFDIPASEELSNTLPMLSSNLLVPPKFEWVLKHFCPQITSAFTDHLIVDQNNATQLIGQNANVVQANAIFYSSRDVYVPKTSLTMGNFSSKSGTGVIYFDLLEDPRITIYQGGNFLIDTNDAEELTAAELSALKTSPYSRQFFQYSMQISEWGNQLILDESPPGFVYGLGKLRFNHNPALGRNYKIVVEVPPDFPDRLLYIWMMFYPVDITLTAGYIIDPSLQGYSQILYNGTMTVETKLNGTPPMNGSTQAFDLIKLRCTGLKPSTTHFFFIDGVLDQANIRQEGKALGAPLISDASGKMVVYYHATDLWYNKVANAKLIPRFSTSSIDNFDLNFVPSYSLFEIKTTSSACFTAVPLLQPNKIIF